VDKADDHLMDDRDDLVDKADDLVAVVVTIDVAEKVDLNLSKKNSKKYFSKSLVLRK
jgi:hypothetical protein